MQRIRQRLGLRRLFSMVAVAFGAESAGARQAALLLRRVGREGVLEREQRGLRRRGLAGADEVHVRGLAVGRVAQANGARDEKASVAALRDVLVIAELEHELVAGL